MTKRPLRSTSLLLAIARSTAQAADRTALPEPAPRHEVRIEQNLMIPMRDGARLSTDRYCPQGDEQQWPVILIRAPYNDTGFGRRSMRLGEHAPAPAGPQRSGARDGMSSVLHAWD